MITKISDEAIIKAHNNWCRRKGVENRKIKWHDWLAQEAQRDTLRQVVELLKELCIPLETLIAFTQDDWAFILSLGQEKLTEEEHFK